MGEDPSGKLEGIPKAIQTADSSFCTHTPLSNNPNHVDENGRNGECTWSTLEESLLSSSSLFQQLSNHLRINSIMGRNPLRTSVHCKVEELVEPGRTIPLLTSVPGTKSLLQSVLLELAHS